MSKALLEANQSIFLCDSSIIWQQMTNFSSPEISEGYRLGSFFNGNYRILTRALTDIDDLVLTVHGLSQTSELLSTK